MTSGCYTPCEHKMWNIAGYKALLLCKYTGVTMYTDPMQTGCFKQLFKARRCNRVAPPVFLKSWGHQCPHYWKSLGRKPSLPPCFRCLYVLGLGLLLALHSQDSLWCSYENANCMPLSHNYNYDWTCVAWAKCQNPQYHLLSKPLSEDVFPK